MTDVTDVTGDPPPALVPIVPVDAAYTDAEQELWTGRGSYVNEGRTFECEARLLRRWHPEPALVLETEAEEPGVGNAFPEGLSNVMFDGLEVEGLVQVGGSFGPVERKRRFELLTATIGEDRPVKAVQFSVPNFPRFLGQPVSGGGSTYAARIEIDAGGWHIRFEGLGGQARSYDALRQAGFGITHLGTIEKGDGSPASVEEVDRAMTIVGWWLSLFRGAYSTPCWWVGVDDDGRPRWTRHADWNVDAWKGEWGLFPSGWFHPEHPEVLDALAGSLDRAFSLMAKEPWEEAMMMTLHLYLVANAGRSTSDLIIAQAGLERLAHATLVLPGKTTGPQFERLTAAKQIQRCMATLGVSAQVPQELPHLAKATTAGAAVARARNRVAHPPRKRLTASQREQERAMAGEARELSLSLLERGLLATIGYDGYIRDRLHGFFLRSLSAGP